MIQRRLTAAALPTRPWRSSSGRAGRSGPAPDPPSPPSSTTSTSTSPPSDPPVALHFSNSFPRPSFPPVFFKNLKNAQTRLRAGFHVAAGQRRRRPPASRAPLAFLFLPRRALHLPKPTSAGGRRRAPARVASLSSRASPGPLARDPGHVLGLPRIALGHAGGGDGGGGGGAAGRHGSVGVALPRAARVGRPGHPRRSARRHPGRHRRPRAAQTFVSTRACACACVCVRMR